MPCFQEFGNFIGEIEDSDDEELQQDEQQQQQYASTSTRLAGYDDDDEEDEDGQIGDGDVAMDDAEEDDTRVGRASNAVILHEDKKYYSTAQEVYGEDVETMVQEEDLQPLSEPIIAPVKTRKFRVEEKDMPATTYDKKCGYFASDSPESSGLTVYPTSFLLDLSSHQESIRNIAVVGHLHHGKTALLDMLVHQTHTMDWNVDVPVRIGRSQFPHPLANRILLFWTVTIYRLAYALTIPRHLVEILTNVPGPASQ